jgi:multiple sugar transport system substrate-binding protein
MALALGSLIIVILFFLRSGRPVELETLTILGEDASTMQAIEGVKGRFEAEHRIKVATTKNAFEVLQQKANADLSSGTGLYDIILNVNSSLSSYVRNGWVFKLADLQKIDPTLGKGDFEKDLFPTTWHEVGFYRTKPGSEPEAIGYPWAANTMLLVYSKRLFNDPKNRDTYRKKYGKELVPPTTWEEFGQIAGFLTKPAAGQYGVVLEGASGGWLYYEWVNFAYSMGGGVMKKSFGWEGDAQTPLILDSAETIAATRFYLGLRPYSAGDFLSTGQNEQVELMRKGNIAMAIIWSDTLFSLVHSPSGEQFGFAPIPGNRSQIGGGIFYINNRSKHAKLAAEFLAFYFQRDTQRDLIIRGLCSPLRSAYGEPGVEAVPYAAALRQALEEGVYMTEAGPDADAVQEGVTSAVQRIWRGETSVEAGLHDAETNLQKKRQAIFSLVK